MKLSTSYLHYKLIATIIDHGFLPTNKDLAGQLKVSERSVIEALMDLQTIHGVVLHPNRPDVWVIHPFSLAPTSFYVTAESKTWWGNCAWCSLGIAALVDSDVTIHTTLGAASEAVKIHIVHGEVIEKDLLVHFPIPMKKAWDNVIYTCSTMLIFSDESQIDNWCKQHNIAKGDVQPIENIWKFSRKWYGNHLNPDWKKWTVDEALDMFREFGLTHPIWHLDNSSSNF